MSQNSTSVNGRKPSHREVADTLRERICSGDLKAGDPMPTQAALVEEFGVERGTIRQALKILQGEGLLTHVTRGAPARIAERTAAAVPRPPASDQPRPTMVALAARLAEAFAETDVRIDVVSLTAESLNLALGEPLRLIHAEQIKPETVRVRILLPSREIELAFPTAVDDGRRDQDAVHGRWLGQRNSQGQVLRDNLRALRPYGIDVSVEFRALPFTPPMKLYLLNNSEALFGYYLVTRREEEVGEKQLEIYDALGVKSLLFSFQGGDGGRDAAYVEESQKWFNALWETISSELRLFE
ncbi:GntR family transcriptional regulator [Streptomyces sp. NPDC050738]|uniref:GntR family transcriptional regulator n=1 Tax=Streptomyces sp. NPDC050738 TaxID=3154744 RepID=UPI003449C60E